MRKKTAIAPKRRRASSSKSSGLIAKGKSPKQSAGAKLALDNRSHRTTWACAAPDSTALRGCALLSHSNTIAAAPDGTGSTTPWLGCALTRHSAPG